MSNLWLIFGMGLVTFLVRYVPFALAGKFELPGTAKTALQFVPPAVLTAIVLPSVLLRSGGQVQLDLSNPYLVGAAITFLGGLYSKNLVITSTLGVVGFYACRWFFQG